MNLHLRAPARRSRRPDRIAAAPAPRSANARPQGPDTGRSQEFSKSSRTRRTASTNTPNRAVGCSRPARVSDSNSVSRTARESSSCTPAHDVPRLQIFFGSRPWRWGPDVHAHQSPSRSTLSESCAERDVQTPEKDPLTIFITLFTVDGDDNSGVIQDVEAHGLVEARARDVQTKRFPMISGRRTRRRKTCRQSRQRSPTCQVRFRRRAER